jgi:hypothetical protein
MEYLRPYIVIEDSDAKLHLKEPKWKKNVMFFIFRVLPFIYIAAMIVILFTMEERNSGALVGMLLMTTFPFIILLRISYPVEVEINSLYITLHLKATQGEYVKNIAIADVEKILVRKRRAKSRGLFYYLIFKASGKRQRFLSFPGFYKRDAKRDYINRKLVSITRLQVENK